jgi:integrase
MLCASCRSPPSAQARSTEWTEIDWDKARWAIPGAKMKMDKDHVVPLSRQALDILKLILRGRSEPLRAYEPLPSTSFTTSATAEYAAAFAKLEAGDAAAMPAFAALAELHADDPLAGFHLRRLLNGAKGTCMRLE